MNGARSAGPYNVTVSPREAGVMNGARSAGPYNVTVSPREAGVMNAAPTMVLYGLLFGKNVLEWFCLRKGRIMHSSSERQVAADGTGITCICHRLNASHVG